MNAVNAVPLLILVWTFTAVCQAADDDISVICENVTGTAGKEVTLNCSVSQSLKCSERCIRLYKFQYPENYKHSVTCRQEFPHDPCEQRNSFTCNFTSNTDMTEQFRFFVQTQCGKKSSEFTVNITEPITPETVTKPPDTSKDKRVQTAVGSGNSSGYKNTVIPAVVGCFFIIILIITLTILYITKLNYSKLCGFQMRMCLGRRHDEDNSNCPESVI